ncbi:MAG: FmdB family transcriptional regulator [Nitrosomonadaceae bacterium]|nr:FmdB family transcriptional regulator [Nitrosomonadaceae bacterium]
MPIYEYQCRSCGSKKEHLQKLSDEPISICPSCDSNAYIKLISAPGFKLKGSGWDATDFKNSSMPKIDPKKNNKPIPEAKPKNKPDVLAKNNKPSSTK